MKLTLSLWAFYVAGLPQAFAAQASFDSALKQMLSRHTAVRIQKTNLDASEVSYTSKSLFFLPNLSLNANEQKSELSDKNSFSRSRSYLATASVNLFRSGADWATMNAAEANRDLQKTIYSRVKLTAEDDSAAALLNLIESMRRVEVLRKNVSDLTSFQNLAQERFSKGYLPRQEVDKVTIDVSNSEARLRDAESSFNNWQEQVTRLWEKPNIPNEWPWKDRLNSSAVNDLLSRKPDPITNLDFISTQHQLAVADASARAQYRMMLPTVDLSYSYGTYQTASYDGPGWESLVTLKIPLFSGLDDYAQYRAKEAAREAAEVQNEQEKRNALSEQDLAQKNFIIARATALAREKTVEVARRLLNANLARFRIGRADANDLNVDQRRVTESELLAHQGWKDAHVALLRLYHAFGKSLIETN